MQDFFCLKELVADCFCVIILLKGVFMKKEVASVVRCEDGAMNYGFSNEEAVKFIAQAGFKKVFMSFQNEHLSGGGIASILNS